MLPVQLSALAYVANDSIETDVLSLGEDVGRGESLGVGGGLNSINRQDLDPELKIPATCNHWKRRCRILRHARCELLAEVLP